MTQFNKISDNEVNIIHTRGDTFLQNIQHKSNGIATNLTGFSFIFSIKKNYRDTAYICSIPCTVTSPTTGIIQINIPASTTKNFELGDFFYDLQETDSLGNIKTILRGEFKIIYDITI